MDLKNWNSPRPPNRRHYVITDGWVVPKALCNFLPPTEMLDEELAKFGMARMYLTDGDCYNLTTHRFEDE